MHIFIHIIYIFKYYYKEKKYGLTLKYSLPIPASPCGFLGVEDFRLKGYIMGCNSQEHKKHL